MHNTPSYQPDRGHYITDRQIVDQKSVEARLSAVETQMAALTARVATLELKVHRIFHHLRFN